jgi:hypothetical protein
VTLSQHHEDLIDITCEAVNDMCAKHSDINIGQGWGVFIEHKMAAVIIPELKHYPAHADAYIFTDDGCGVIMLEVGNMPESKWSGFTNKESETKIRILRVGKDKSFYLHNPQNTEAEIEFMGFLAQRLAG